MAADKEESLAASLIKWTFGIIIIPVLVCVGFWVLFFGGGLWLIGAVIDGLSIKAAVLIAIAVYIAVKAFSFGSSVLAPGKK